MSEYNISENVVEIDIDDLLMKVNTIDLLLHVITERVFDMLEELSGDGANKDVMYDMEALFQLTILAKEKSKHALKDHE